MNPEKTVGGEETPEKHAHQRIVQIRGRLVPSARDAVERPGRACPVGGERQVRQPNQSQVIV